MAPAVRYGRGNPAPRDVVEKAVAELNDVWGDEAKMEAVAKRAGMAMDTLKKWRLRLGQGSRRNQVVKTEATNGRVFRTEDEKRDLVKQFLSARAMGEPVKDILERLGLPSGAIYPWLERFKDEASAAITKQVVGNGQQQHSLEFDSEESSERGVDPATGRAVERFVSKQRARVNGGPDAPPPVAPARQLPAKTNGNGHHEIPLEVEVAMLRSRNVQLRKMVYSLQKIIAESVEAY